MKTAVAAAALALAASAVAVAPAHADDNLTVDITGTVYTCHLTDLTVTSGTLSLTTKVTYPTADSVRIQEQWSVASPVRLKDSAGNRYEMTDQGGGTTGDVTTVGAGYLTGTATENWSFNYMKNDKSSGRFGNQRLTRTYFADGSQSVSYNGNCGAPLGGDAVTGALTKARQLQVAKAR